MDGSPSEADSSDRGAVQLHLHRGIGWGMYGSAAAAVLVITLLGVGSYVTSERWWMAGLSAVVGLPLAAFLATLTQAMVRPALTATAAGIRGRMPRGGPVETDWEHVSIDVDENAPPATLRLAVGDQSVSIDARAWTGFTDFVLLLATTPRAAARLTPSARTELLRLLRIEP